MSNAPTAPARDRTIPLLVLCLLVVFLFVFLLFIPFTSDDSYITMRYARNAADGLGLVFNPGERVEGYSNPLWLGLLVVAAQAGLDLPAASKLLGIGAGLAALLLAVGIVMRLDERRSWWAALGLLPLATSASLAVYAASGLETVLYACFLTGIVYCWLVGSAAAWWGLAACALGAALTRPEGAMVLLAVLAWGAASRFVPLSRDDGPPARPAVMPALVAVLGLVAFLLARHAYFGDWLPNTFYAKPPGAFGTVSLLAPLGYLRDYLVDGGMFLWVGLAVWLLRAVPRSRPAVVAGLWVAGVQAALVMHARGDWMGLHRFLLPAAPLLVAVGYAGLLRAVSSKVAVAALLVLIGTVNVIHLAEVRGEFIAGRYPYNVMAGQPQEMAGKWLRQHFPPDTLLACKRIGGVSYFSGMPMVDTLGLVDRRIAMIRHASASRGEQEQRAIAAEVFSRQPDLVLLAVMKRWSNLPLDQPAPDVASNLRDVDDAIYRELVARGYRFVMRLPQGGDGELVVYARPGLTVPPLSPP